MYISKMGVNNVKFKTEKPFQVDVSKNPIPKLVNSVVMG